MMRLNTLIKRVLGLPAACFAAAAVRLGFLCAHEDTFMPVGLSWWIALGKVLRLPPIWLPLWQVAASVATVAFLGLAVRRLTHSDRSGALAGWIAATYPPFLYYQGFLFTETTTAALVAAAIAVAAGGLQRARDTALVGLTLGAAAVWRTNVALVRAR